MKPKYPNFLPVLFLSSALVSASFGQTTGPADTDGTAQPSPTLPSPRAQSQTGQVGPSDSSTYASGKALEGQSKEGFWGHLNPFARKKWVNRQVDPIKDRTNELDQLEAKNANDIRDADARSQAGINRAMSAANTADQHAADARSRAESANGLAAEASNRTAALNGTVSGLDQYQTVSTAPVLFGAGRTTLGPKGKAQLDEVASRIADEKGYIIEVQGYSRGGVQTSEAMADSVVRYLVTEHRVPLYRIYRTGLGRNTQKTEEGARPVTNGVVVSLLHNSLATLSANRPAAAPGSAGAGDAAGASNLEAVR